MSDPTALSPIKCDNCGTPVVLIEAADGPRWQPVFAAGAQVNVCTRACTVAVVDGVAVAEWMMARQRRYTADDLALAKRDGFQLAITALRDEAEAQAEVENYEHAHEAVVAVNYLERVKEAIVGG